MPTLNRLASVFSLAAAVAPAPEPSVLDLAVQVPQDHGRQNRRNAEGCSNCTDTCSAIAASSGQRRR